MASTCLKLCLLFKQDAEQQGMWCVSFFFFFFFSFFGGD
jgi:hypothetical protein